MGRLTLKVQSLTILLLIACSLFSVELMARSLGQPYRLYSFEQNNFNSGVTDSSPNGQDGSAVGNFTPDLASSNLSCKVGDNAPNTSYNTISALNTGVTPRDIGNAGTIAFWFKLDNTISQSVMLIDGRSVGSNQGQGTGGVFDFSVSLDAQGRPYLFIEDSDGTNRTFYGNQLNLTANQWYFFAFSWDASISNPFKLLVNNVSSNSLQFKSLTKDNGSNDDNQSFGNFPANGGAIYIGDNRITHQGYGDDYVSGNSFAGQIDEVSIFQSSLNISELTELKSRVSSCPVTIDLMQKLSFEQTSFSGGVTDTSGEGNNATVTSSSKVTSVLPSPVKSCRAVSIASNTTRQSKWAVNTGLTPNQIGQQGTIAFWYKPNQDSGTQKVTLFDATYKISNNNYRGFSATIDTADDFNFYVSGARRGYTSGALDIDAGEWVFIAFSWDYTNNSNPIRVVVSKSSESVSYSSFGEYSNTNVQQGTMPSFNTLYLGDNRSDWNNSYYTSYRSANGTFDEFVVYQGVLSEAELAQIKSDTQPCAQVHHYEIEHDGLGLTCVAERVTIKACEDASCSSLYTGNVSFNFDSVTGGSWSPNSFSFSGGSGSFDLSYTNTGNVDIGINNTSPSGTNATECDVNANCRIAFSDQGFEVEAVDGSDIGTQVAESNFSFRVRSLKDDGSNNFCVASVPNGSVEFRQVCTDPNSCTGNKFSANGTTVSSSGYTSVSGLSFNAQGVATVTGNYGDAGRIRLDIRHDINNNNGAPYAYGSSNVFLVKPQRLVMVAKDGALTTANDGKQPAGTPFDFDIYALGTLGSTPLRNYQSGTLQMKASMNQPTASAGTAGVFNNGKLAIALNDTYVSSGITAADFASSNNADSDDNLGEYNGNASYSEVGIITLEVRDTNYFGEAIAGDSLLVSRFTPAYFSIESSGTGISLATTPAVVYVGQNINFSTDTTVTLAARNAQGAITQNYDIVPFFRQPTSSGSIFPQRDYTTNVAAALSHTNNNGFVLSGHTDGDGVFTYTMSVANHDVVNYVKNSTVYAPSKVDFDFVLSQSDLTDADGIGYDADGQTNGIIYTGWDTQVASVSDSRLRWGRLVLKNAHGPETEKLLVDAVIEYCLTVNAGSCTEWLVNAQDSHSKYNSSDLTIIAKPSNWTLAKPAVSGSFQCGQIYSPSCGVSPGDFMSVGAPGAGNTGQVEVQLNVPQWLEFDWDGVAGLDDPTAILTFGVYNGNQRIISWQEIED